MFIAALFTVAKTQRQPKCLLKDDWFRMWCIYIYIYIMEYYSVIKKMKYCHLQQHRWT